ncbi:MAG: phage portal protein [Candidatus Gastranaerophilales bacterium]|nr:phage portal protein [Candidatus Gastranaerophilales bacterium]
MKFFNFRNKNQEQENEIRQSDDLILKSFISEDTICEREAMNIPAVSKCVSLIADTVSMIPIKLYKEEFLNGKRKTVEVEDERCDLFNLDTKDTLDGVQFKRALVRDYLLFGGAYAYIKKRRNTVKSLNYVSFENVHIIENFDPIFKDYNILIGGQSYKPFEFLKVLRSTKDGANGIGIINQNQELLKVAYLTLKFEQSLVSTGGSKKGFIKSEKKITKEAMDSLKKAWRELYCNTENNVIVLNDNLDFKEASNTSTEMQLNENKNSINNSILDIFGVPTDWNWETFIKTAVMPILSAIECALNRDLLLEKEKKSFYFAFDTKEITKGDIKTRFEAYKTALDANLMQIDECRYMEDLEPLGLNFIKLGLQDVLFNPQTKEVYTPNTNKVTNISDTGGKNFENRNQE